MKPEAGSRRLEHRVGFMQAARSDFYVRNGAGSGCARSLQTDQRLLVEPVYPGVSRGDADDRIPEYTEGVSGAKDARGLVHIYCSRPSRPKTATGGFQRGGGRN